MYAGQLFRSQIPIPTREYIFRTSDPHIQYLPRRHIGNHRDILVPPAERSLIHAQPHVSSDAEVHALPHGKSLSSQREAGETPPEYSLPEAIQEHTLLNREPESSEPYTRDSLRVEPVRPTPYDMCMYPDGARYKNRTTDNTSYIQDTPTRTYPYRCRSHASISAYHPTRPLIYTTERKAPNSCKRSLDSFA